MFKWLYARYSTIVVIVVISFFATHLVEHVDPRVLFPSLNKVTVYILKKKGFSFSPLFKYSIFEYLNACVLFTMIKKFYVLNFEYIRARALRETIFWVLYSFMIEARIETHLPCYYQVAKIDCLNGRRLIIFSIKKARTIRGQT